MSDDSATPQHPSDPGSQVPPPPMTPPSETSAYRVTPRMVPKSELVAKIALGVAVIGSFMPWARVLFFTVNGTDGDGIITALTAGLALILVFVAARRDANGQSSFSTLAWGAVSAVIAAAVYVYDFVNVSSISDESADDMFDISVQPQIGLIAGSIGAVIGAVACVQLAIRSRKLASRS